MSSNLRIGGLISGMDTDTIVADLMKVERMKVDRLKQDAQLYEWQQEDYRTINSTLRSFRDNTIFNMKLQSTFLAKMATSSNKDAIAVSASGEASVGTHTIKVTQLAQAASVTSSAIGSNTDKTTLDKQLNGLDDSEKIIINDTVFNFDPSKESIYDLVGRINNQRVVGITSRITTAAVDPDEENNIVGVKQVQKLEFADGISDGMIIKIGNKSIGLFSGTDANAAKAAMGVDEAISINDGTETVDPAAVVGKIAALSIDGVELSVANSTELVISSKEVGTEKAVTATVSGGKDWNVHANYDSTLDRFFLTTTQTGKDQEINIDNTTLSDALKITQGAKFYTSDIAGSTVPTGLTYKEGLNAKVEIDGLEINDIYTDNSITLNGITYNLYNTTNSEVIVTVSQDTESVYKSVTSFVEEYNKVLETLESTLNEQRYKDYKWPLSDDELASLTDEQIDQWKEKAQSGLLRNDETLRQLRDSMRLTVSALSKMGITTTTDYQTGKLEITPDGEKKLREAISNDLQGVMDIFTGEQGVAQKLSNKLSSTITTIINKAGSSGSKVDDESYLGERIGDLNDDIDVWEDRLKEIEDRYWKKFTAMETALSQLNSQSSWLMQQFSS